MAATVHIQSIRAWEVVVPTHKGAVDSEGFDDLFQHRPWAERPICILEFQMSDGVKGLGEIGRGVTLAQIELWLKQLIGREISGRELVEYPEGWRADTWAGLLSVHPPANWSSKTPVAEALEMALLDWCGRRLGCRAVDLLGGAYRQTVSVEYWCARQRPADLARIVTKARERGFTGLKMKSRHGDPTMEQLRAIRDAAGEDFAVTIDPMYQWFDPQHALALFKQMEKLGTPIRIEDPFPKDHPDHWRRVQQVTAIPLIWHARSWDDMRIAAQDHCYDDFNISGGIAEFLAKCHIAEVLGHSCWHGSSIEMGVGQVAHLHAAAAARCCVLNSDFVSGLIREHTCITWDWPYKDGALPLPEGPGLGIELDMKAIARYQRGQLTV
jgi:muconate cycloisomerase